MEPKSFQLSVHEPYQSVPYLLTQRARINLMESLLVGFSPSSALVSSGKISFFYLHFDSCYLDFFFKKKICLLNILVSLCWLQVNAGNMRFFFLFYLNVAEINI